MARNMARLVIAALAMLSLVGIPLGGSWLAAPAVLLLILAMSPTVGAHTGRWGLVGSAIGLLGGGIGIAAVLLAMVNRGTESPFDSRVGFAVAALLLAAVALAGGALVASRPRSAIGMLLAGSTTGCLAMALFTIDTWYFAALPLCWLAAAIAVVRSMVSGVA